MDSRQSRIPAISTRNRNSRQYDCQNDDCQISIANNPNSITWYSSRQNIAGTTEPTPQNGDTGNQRKSQFHQYRGAAMGQTNCDNCCQDHRIPVPNCRSTWSISPCRSSSLQMLIASTSKPDKRSGKNAAYTKRCNTLPPSVLLLRKFHRRKAAATH